jgi:DNA (cytosine-5)-methyltransferase 1
MMGKNFAEFFAGIGLVHAGLRPGGWECIYANDIDAKKRAMYEGEFGPAAYYHVADVWDTEAVLSRLPGTPFLATASFPCIDLSLAGHWRGLDGAHSSAYFGFIEALRAMQGGRPQVVMLENVYGFLTSGGGRDFQRALIELAKLGYWLDALLLDARWFVPQSRPRMFIFGFQDSLTSAQLIRSCGGFSLTDEWRAAIERTRALRPDGLRSVFESLSLPTGWATVDFTPPRQARYQLMELLELDEQQEWWDERETTRHYEMMEAPSKARVDELIRERATLAGTGFRRTRREKTRLEVRFDVAGCLRTPRGGSAKQIVVAVLSGRFRLRWMTAREYARLQGAPDYRITVPTTQAMFGFGDAVCVPAIAWLDERILTPVYESTLGKTRLRSPSVLTG